MSILASIANYFSVLNCTQIVEVPEDNNAEFTKSVAALQKRAARLGCEPLVVTKFAVVDVVRTHSQQLSDYRVRRWNVVIPTHMYAVSGGMPKLPEAYELMGVAEFTPAGAIIKAVPGKEIPPKYREGRNHCDHCNKSRERTGTVIVRNKATGDVCQVGGQCVKDFLGAKLSQFLAGFEFQSELFGGAGGDEPWGCSRGTYSYDTFQYIACVCAVIRKDGMFKPAAMDSSTRSSATTMMIDLSKGKKVDITDADYDEAEVLIEKAKTILSENRTLSDFEWNVKMGLADDTLNKSVAGHLAAISKLVYGRSPAKEAVVKPVSDHVGKVGDKLTMTVKYVNKVAFESVYGVTYIRMFEDLNGNMFTWKTGTSFYMKDVQLNPGMTLQIKGTVKAHTVYKEVKQTELLRVVAISIEA